MPYLLFSAVPEDGLILMVGCGRVGTRTSEIKKYFCYRMLRCGIWYWCIVGFVN